MEQRIWSSINHSTNCWIRSSVLLLIIVKPGVVSCTIEDLILTLSDLYIDFFQNGEDKASENWERKTAIVLLKSGNTRLLSALSDSIANSIPCLARASLVTVCWLSSYLHSIGDGHLQLESCSILVPHLIHILTHDTSNLQDKILASFSLHSLVKGTGKHFSKSCMRQFYARNVVFLLIFVIFFEELSFKNRDKLLFAIY